MQYDGPGNPIHPARKQLVMTKYEANPADSITYKRTVMTGAFSSGEREYDLTPYFDDDIFATLLGDLASVIWPYCDRKGSKGWKMVDDGTRDTIYTAFAQKFNSAMKKIKGPTVAEASSDSVKEIEEPLPPSLAGVETLLQTSIPLVPSDEPQSIEGAAVEEVTEIERQVGGEITINDQVPTGSKRKQGSDETESDRKQITVYKRTKATEEDSGEE